MHGFYTPNHMESKSLPSWITADMSHLAEASESPRRGRQRRGRARTNQNGNRNLNGNGGLVNTPPMFLSDDGMSDREAGKEDGMTKVLEARQREKEDLRVRMEMYQAKRRQEMEGREKREAEELQNKISAEEADPVLRKMRNQANTAHNEWEHKLLQMPANQAWTEVKDTEAERVSQWQKLKLMGGVEYRPTRGLCEHMCSASEVVERISTTDVMAPERDPITGRPDPARFVKRYKRVEPVIIPTDVRTPSALMNTSSYLFDVLLDRVGYGDVYGFVEDRARAIMKDYSVQRITDVSAMAVHERIARFYAYSAYTMYETYQPNPPKQVGETFKLAVPAQGYNPILNKQQLDKDLLTLKNLYMDNHKVQGVERRKNLFADLFDHEAEMTAYRLISDYVEYRFDFRKYAVMKRDWEQAQVSSAVVDYSTMPRDPGPPHLRWDYAARMTPCMFMASDLIECAKGGEVAAPPPVTECRYRQIAPEVRFFDLMMLPTTPPLFTALFMEEFGWIRVQAIEKLVGGKPGYVKASTLEDLLKFDSEEQVTELASACGLMAIKGPDGNTRVGWRRGDVLNFVDPVLPRQPATLIWHGKFPENIPASRITLDTGVDLHSWDYYPQLSLQPYFEVIEPYLAASDNRWTPRHISQMDVTAQNEGDGDEVYEMEDDGQDMDGEEGAEVYEGEDGDGDGDEEAREAEGENEDEEPGNYEDEDHGEYQAQSEEDQAHQAPPTISVPSLLARLGGKVTNATLLAPPPLNPSAAPFVPSTLEAHKPASEHIPMFGSLFSGSTYAAPREHLSPFSQLPGAVQPKLETNSISFGSNVSGALNAAPAPGQVAHASTDPGDAASKQALFTATFGSLFRPKPATDTTPIAPPSSFPPSAPLFPPPAPSPSVLPDLTQMPSTGMVAQQAAPTSSFEQSVSYHPAPFATSTVPAPSSAPAPVLQFPAPTNGFMSFSGLRPFGFPPVAPQQQGDDSINGVFRQLRSNVVPLSAPLPEEKTPAPLLSTRLALDPLLPIPSAPQEVVAEPDVSLYMPTALKSEASSLAAPSSVEPSPAAPLAVTLSPVSQAALPQITVSVPEPSPSVNPVHSSTDSAQHALNTPETIYSGQGHLSNSAEVAIAPVERDQFRAPADSTIQLSPPTPIDLLDADQDQITSRSERRRDSRGVKIQRISLDEAVQMGLGNPALNGGFTASTVRMLPKFNDREEADKRRKADEAAKAFGTPDTMHELLQQRLHRLRRRANRDDPIRGFQTWVVPSHASSQHAAWLASKFHVHLPSSTQSGMRFLTGYVERPSEGLVPPSPGLIIFECSSNIMPDNFSSSACQADKQRLLEFLHAIPDIQSYRASLLIIVHGDFFSGSTALICRNLGLDTLPPSVQDARVVTLKNESVWVPEIEDSLMSLQFDVFGLPIEGTSPRDCMDHLIMLWGQKLWDALPELPGTPIIQPMFQAFISGIDVASSQLWKMSVQADSPCPLSLPSFAHRRTSTWKQAIEAVGEYLQQPVFGHGYAISQARQFLHQLAGQVAKAPKTYGIEVFPIFEHIGNHVAGMIIADSSRVTFRDEFLGRDLLPALQKNVRSNWAAVIADFNIAYQSLPQCSSPLLSTKRERGDDPLVGEDMKMSPPKRTKIGQNNVSVVNGALSAPRTTSTRPKKGTLHSLRARIKLANALAAGETDGH